MTPTATFNELAERYRPELLAYMIRLLGDVHDAEDACQDALLRAYRAYARLTPGSNVRAWLYKIATNTAFNALKRRGRIASRTADEDLEQLAAESDATFALRERLRAIAQAVEALPPKQRAALMLRQFHGLSYAEIAASIGGNAASARANVYVAVHKIRQALAD